jgi:hypothetical protein
VRAQRADTVAPRPLKLIVRHPKMTPIAGRNVANGIIVAGLLPVLLWLYLLTLVALHPDDFLPWTTAGIIMLGIPFSALSLLIAVPAMLYARNKALQNRAVWTPAHRIPLFLGVVTFLIAVIAAIWLVIANSKVAGA